MGNEIEDLFEDFASTYIKFNLNQEIVDRLMETIGYDTLKTIYENDELDDEDIKNIQNRFDKYPHTPFFLMYVFEVLTLIPLQEDNLTFLVKKRMQDFNETKIVAVENILLRIKQDLELVIYIFENFADKDNAVLYFIIHFISYFKRLNDRDYVDVVDDIYKKLGLTCDDALLLFIPTTALTDIFLLTDKYYSHYLQNNSAKPEKIKFTKPFFNEYIAQVINKAL